MCLPLSSTSCSSALAAHRPGGEEGETMWEIHVTLKNKSFHMNKKKIFIWKQKLDWTFHLWGILIGIVTLEMWFLHRHINVAATHSLHKCTMGFLLLQSQLVSTQSSLDLRIWRQRNQRALSLPYFKSQQTVRRHASLFFLLINLKKKRSYKSNIN